MGLLPDYSRQALGYDTTRGASPSVLDRLRRALADAPGSRLLDVGGGTGNYAVAAAGEGWQPTVLDCSPAMLDQARAKGLETIIGDAQQLPFADASFDAVTLISMLHHVESPQAALAEACRVLVAGGRLAAVVFTREDIAEAWCLEYFPSSRPWMEETHPPVAELLVGLDGAALLSVEYHDVIDGSLAAMMCRPELILEAHRRSQTSFFERMERDHPEELGAGLERLARELQAGDGPDRPGRATVIAWGKPRWSAAEHTE